MDRKTSFDNLWEAAKSFSMDTKLYHTNQSITTIANQASYAIAPDYIEILTDNGEGKKTIKYADSTTFIGWPTWIPYSQLLTNNNTTGITYPNNFSLADSIPKTQITGTALATSADVNGESTLSGAGFANVYPGDSVINTTSGYIGRVVSRVSATSLITAMFDINTTGSPKIGWTLGNTYIVIPQSGYDLVLDPSPSTSGHIITLYYYARPSPVYSDSRSYSFATGYEEALIKYAVWLYKYRDKQPNFGDAMYRFYDAQVRRARTQHRLAAGVKTFQVSFKKD